MQSLGKYKAIGIDGISAEVLVAGGWAMAVHIHQLIMHIVSTEVVPLDFRGGRLVDVWKRKGDQEVCDNSRGLLISNHISQVLTTLIKDHIADTYESYVSPVQ
eukprot:1223358-Karenia_brevis.AAC.1